MFTCRSLQTEPLRLLSCSMDKTMIIWTSPADASSAEYEEGCDVWTESVRVGEVGGNVLGFLGGQFAPDAPAGQEEVLGYSFNGAFHSWIKDGDDRSWRPGVVMGGHFAPAEDLDWDKSGRYVQ
jgi:elongator complex protein 2